MTDVIVLNGASSSGKTSIARALQQALAPEEWLTFGVDTLIGALPASLGAGGGGLDLAEDGTITVGPAFRTIEAAWYEGLGAIARAGAHLVVDEVFLGGAESQARLRSALDGLEVRWVGVRCSAAEGERRERARGDRVAGQHVHQAGVVHVGVTYDLEVDTTSMTAGSCARAIAELVRGFVGEPAGPG